MTKLFIVFGLLGFLTGASGQHNFQTYFGDCRVEGSTTIFDYKNNKWFFTDSADSRRTTLPASTFKIINTLIVLESGVLKDENQVLKYPGSQDTSRYGYRPSTYHDMNLQEAFKKSVVWFYLNLAEKLGRDIYKDWLQRAGYGNDNLSHPDADFWNFGSFAISPLEQVNFLVRIYEQKPPFSKRSYHILKKIMLQDSTSDHRIHAKTGWTSQEGMHVGWFVGYLENKDNVYFFATRLQKPRPDKNPDFAKCRKSITMKILRAFAGLQF